MSGAPFRVLISVGSNIEPRRNLPAALRRLAGRARVLAVSRVYETLPVGAAEAPVFLNAAILAETRLAPADFKRRVLRRVEDELGRRRSSDPDAPRTIDLDIALFDGVVLSDPESGLEIPHPDVLRYAHVAVPLADLAPELEHPVTGARLAAIAAGFEPLVSIGELTGWRSGAREQP